MTPDSPEFDFYISATSESDVAQEVARVLRDAGYTIYLPERKDEAATKRFAASKSKAFVLPLMNDNQQSQFLADILNFAPLGIAEGRVVVIQFEDCELAGLIDPNLVTNLSGLTNSRARKLRIINAVEVPLPTGAPTEADEVPPQPRGRRRTHHRLRLNHLLPQMGWRQIRLSRIVGSRKSTHRAAMPARSTRHHSYLPLPSIKASLGRLGST